MEMSFFVKSIKTSIYRKNFLSSKKPQNIKYATDLNEFKLIKIVF